MTTKFNSEIETLLATFERLNRAGNMKGANATLADIIRGIVAQIEPSERRVAVDVGDMSPEQATAAVEAATPGPVAVEAPAPVQAPAEAIQPEPEPEAAPSPEPEVQAEPAAEPDVDGDPATDAPKRKGKPRKAD
jgi:hypothetical protein